MLWWSSLTDVPRRDLLRLLAVTLGAALVGCASHESPSALAPPARRPLSTTNLEELLPRAGLRWLMSVRPRAVGAVEGLAPSLEIIAPDAGWDRLLTASGIDVRRVDQACIASYEGGAMIYVVRHEGEPRTIEERFLARLTRAERRVSQRPDVVRISGEIGAHTHVLVLLGGDVAVFQDGGDPLRGPARVAELYALRSLRRSPTALSDEPLRGLSSRLGAAPARAFAEGPFEGELARGVGGLLAAATSIGAAARPERPGHIALSIVLTGEFGRGAPEAAVALTAAWNDLAGHRFGHLLGLDEPASPAVASSDAGGLELVVAVHALPLARGLAAMTSADLATIMR